MRFAVIPAAGIGDALIMLIASHHLRTLDHEVTTFHRQLPSFGRWLEKGEYLQPIENSYPSFDAILLQHDNTLIARQIVSLRKNGASVFIFYPTYLESKHGPLINPLDYAFDHNLTMAENCQRGSIALFGGHATLFNGLHPLPELSHRKHRRRVLLHPTSADEKKNWPKGKFLRLAELLEEKNFEPCFILSPAEKKAWPEVESPDLPTLEDLASLIYESDYFIGNDSGPGHLASYLSIPHLIIAQDERMMRRWRPGWHQGQIIYPPRWLPNLKGLRLRENKWKQFISINSVLNQFISMIK